MEKSKQQSRPGRPSKLDALSPAERQRRYREARRLDMLALQSKSHVTQMDRLSLVALQHMSDRCGAAGTPYSLEQLINSAIRGQLASWGYSFVDESQGKVYFGTSGDIVRSVAGLTVEAIRGH